MDVRDYEYIVAIAEQGSITRAAAHLFITQSALTKFLQRTERDLGLALFVRDGSRFQLTEAGRRYVETGRAIIHLDRQLEEQLNQEFASQKERIRLGFPAGQTDDILRNVLPALYERFPDTRVFARGDSSRSQMTALHSDDLDLAVVTNAEREPGYRYLPLEKSRMVLMVREDSPLLSEAEKKSGYPCPAVPKEKLNGLPMVTMPASTDSGSLTMDMCRKYGLKPDFVLEVSDVRALIDAVECGYGAAVFLSVPIEGRKVRYLSIEGVECPEQMNMLVYRSDRELSPAMSYLIQLLTKGESFM